MAHALETGTRRMRTLSWADFDRALDSAVARLASSSLSGVYGVPRGGLVLAVCLSHRLGIPLLEQPQAGCLVVDDIYETGRTVAPYRERSDLTTLVWISKVPPLWWQALEVQVDPEWILFPWENAEAALADEEQYRASRSHG